MDFVATARSDRRGFLFDVPADSRGPTLKQVAMCKLWVAWKTVDPFLFYSQQVGSKWIDGCYHRAMDSWMDR